jgi:hypothetical protein
MPINPDTLKGEVHEQENDLSEESFDQLIAELLRSLRASAQ